MSTTDYLKNLSYNQLVFCRDQAEEMIRAIDEEKKRVVWFVHDDGINQEWFRTEDFLSAQEFANKMQIERWKDADHSAPDILDLKVHVIGRRVPESEYIALFGEDA